MSLFGKKKEEKKESEWKLDKQKDALQYKMRFVCTGSDKKSLDKNFCDGIVWWNMGDSQDTAAGFMAKEDVTLTIVCMIPELLNYIREHIEAFFIAHNFGRMQNKGFGSYIISKIDNNDIRTPSEKKIANILCSYYGSRDCYHFSSANHSFGRINIVWSIIKSGINFNGYRRSLLFMYMHSHFRLANEKAGQKYYRVAPAIYKRKANSNGVFTESEENYNERKELAREYQNGMESTAGNEGRYYYVRALLGIGEKAEWLSESGGKVSIKTSCSDVERLSAPILFKVIGNEVYYVGKPICRDILGKKFTFTNERTKKTQVFAVPSSEQLTLNNRTPDQFMDDFLDYCYRNFENNVPPKQKKLSEFKKYGMITVTKATRGE